MQFYKAQKQNGKYSFIDLDNKKHEINIQKKIDARFLRGRWMIPVRFTGSFNGVQYGKCGHITFKVDPKRLL